MRTTCTYHTHAKNIHTPIRNLLTSRRTHNTLTVMSAQFTRFNFNIPEPLKARIDVQAKKRGLSASEIVRRLIEKAMDQMEAKEQTHA